jgi:hypothetical protein
MTSEGTAAVDGGWIRGLLRAEAFDHPVSGVEIIETHISWVILTGDYAYKIKKPVDLGFLDFSTVEKRRTCCEAEVRLNQRMAPTIYLDVVTITGARDAPRVNGDGPVLDYAVRMRQFDQAEHLDAFAAAVADFHERAARVSARSSFGTPDAVWAPVAENFAHIGEKVPSPGADSAYARLERWSRGRWEALASIFRERRAAGFVRECHGDLHLRNLAWVDGTPVAFDCIEFNDNLRWIDVLSDVAFLVMDLQDRGQPRFASRFLNAYLEHTGDYGHLEVLPYYLAYRALVRAKVTAIRLGQEGLGASEQDTAEQEFEAYLDLALGYARAPEPMLVVTCGLSGSGKTTLTTPLLEMLDAIRLRSDVERKRLYGLKPHESGRADVGEGIYDAAAGDRTYARLLELARALLGAGKTVIVDATFLDPARRVPFEALARELAVRYRILELTASPEVLKRRLRARRGDASDADVVVLERQLERWPSVTGPERSLAVSVDTEQTLDVESLAARLQAD